ncbi:hypothetical protein SH528x_002504 [Novipirellula sp. SH528]|uniref:hypothetical protein n=1 Tax=Novipirellula sp. SH528 TaxID=3454466 RepID=UPI003F9F47F0
MIERDKETVQRTAAKDLQTNGDARRRAGATDGHRLVSVALDKQAYAPDVTFDARADRNTR